MSALAAGHHDREPMRTLGDRLFEEWRSHRDGFAPLFIEPVMEAAFHHLAGAMGPGARVLDLGSGFGHVGDTLHSCGAHTLRLDVDRSVVAEARANYPGCEDVAGDASQLPFATGSMDALFCFSVLQYTDRPAALAEIRRVLRPGGRVVIVENLVGSPFALAHRAWRVLTDARLPPRLTPKQHLAWSRRGELLAAFPDARVDAHYVVGTACLLLHPMWAANEATAAGSPLRRLLEATRPIDRWLLRALPASAHAAWMLMLRG